MDGRNTSSHNEYQYPITGNTEDRNKPMGRGNGLNTKQPPPTQGNTDVWALVFQDLLDRVKCGREKHGTYLQVENGRDALIDAYQEIMDALFYLRQEIERRKKNE